jgi:hypothetical protein
LQFLTFCHENNEWLESDLAALKEIDEKEIRKRTKKAAPPAPKEEKSDIADSAVTVPETTKPPDPSQYKTKWVILPDDDIVIC